MKVTFYSNFLNHHQLPFCLKMQELLGDDFKFIATESTYDEQKKLGYEDMNKKYPFVITTYDSEEKAREAMRLAVESDVIIHGSAPEIYVKERMKFNKLTFKYSERVFKTGKWHILSPRAMMWFLKNHIVYLNKKLYMLCASAYAAGDFNLVGAYKGKTYKWGYFPQVKKYEKINDIIDKKEPASILWVGRMIGWKHPELPVIIAKRLKEDGYDFKLNMIGIGDKEEKIKKIIANYGLEENVHMLGAMPPDKVREHMENASIYLFTSDFNEGWGAVLNESMNSACAVVASHAIGSVPFLLEDGKNGHIYKNGDIDDLYTKVKKFLDNPEMAKEMGKNAYNTLCTTWNAEEGATRFVELIKELEKDTKYAFKSGPLSPAERMSNHWFKKRTKGE